MLCLVRVYFFTGKNARHFACRSRRFQDFQSCQQLFEIATDWKILKTRTRRIGWDKQKSWWSLGIITEPGIYIWVANLKCQVVLEISPPLHHVSDICVNSDWYCFTCWGAQFHNVFRDDRDDQKSWGIVPQWHSSQTISKSFKITQNHHFSFKQFIFQPPLDTSRAAKTLHRSMHTSAFHTCHLSASPSLTTETHPRGKIGLLIPTVPALSLSPSEKKMKERPYFYHMFIRHIVYHNVLRDLSINFIVASCFSFFTHLF